MKKILAILLAATMLMGVFISGCENQDMSENGFAVESAVDVLEQVWASYDDNEKFYVAGGDSNHMVENMPGTFDITMTAELDDRLGIPEDATVFVDDAASLVDGRIANLFTSGVFHLDGFADATDFAILVKDNIMKKRWLDAQPDKLIVATIDGNYVVVAFGVADSIDMFEGKLTAVTQAEIIIEQNLSE